MGSSYNHVWLITGCSSGFGQCIAEAALAHGDTVVATGRNLKALGHLEGKGAVIKELDVTAPDRQIDGVISDILKTVGKIDILVNNAGYILTGAVEEVNRDEALHQFNTNVFGQLNVSRAVLPHMRARRSGVVANFGSIGSWRGVAGGGIYCGTKAACSIHSEALRHEVAHLGIEVTAVEPGYFRTNFLTSKNRKRAAKRLSDLVPATEPAAVALDEKNLQQPGDPVKAAQLLVEALTKTGRCEGRNLPARLALGKDAVTIVPSILDNMRQDIAAWSELTGATDFGEGS